MKIIDLLDELAADVNEGRKSLFGSRNTYDADFIMSIVEAIRAVLPQDLAEAQQVLDQRDQIITEAEQYARKIIADARQQAAEAVDDHRIVQAANRESNQIIGAAKQRARELRVASDDYALGVLEDLGAYIAEYAAIVAENRSIFLDKKNRNLRQEPYG